MVRRKAGATGAGVPSGITNGVGAAVPGIGNSGNSSPASEGEPSGEPLGTASPAGTCTPSGSGTVVGDGGVGTCDSGGTTGATSAGMS